MGETPRHHPDSVQTTEERQHIEHFFARLQMINRHLRAGAHWHAGREITRVQWLILRHVRRHPGCTVGQLAERIDVRSSTMSQMLDRLEREQLIVRRADGGDSRVRNVRLTPAGEQCINAVEAEWLDRLHRPFSTLTPAEQQTLTALLDKLAAGIETAERCGAANEEKPATPPEKAGE